MGKFLFLLCFIGLTFSISAQNVGIGTNTPMSKLHVAGAIRSDTLVYIGPGVRSLFAAPNGRIYDSLAVPAALSWEINGNSNITATNFLGTTNANDVIFKTNNIERARILSSGNIGINTTAPSVLFSNSALHAGDQSGVGTQVAMGMDWNANSTGYAASFYNSGTVAGSGGALIKITDITAGSRALTVNSGVIGTGTDLLTVLGNGNTGIGTNAPANKLEIKSATANTSGLRFTNLTSASPTVAANGKALSVDVNGDVVLMPSAADAWKLLGNAGTTAGTNFLGTTDGQDLVFKTNNLERMRTLASNGYVGIGITNPSVNLEVDTRVRVSSSNPLIELNGTFAPIPSLASMAIRSAGEVVHRSNTNNAAIVDWELKYGYGTTTAPIDAFYIGRRTAPTATLSSFMLINNLGNVGIGTITPNNRVEITSSAANTSGLRFTNLTSASPTVAANGKALSVDVNGDVVLMPSAADAWKLLGNAGTTAGTNFLGTTDAQDLVFKTNNIEHVRTLATNGNVGINHVAPLSKLTVQERFDGNFSVLNPFNKLTGISVEDNTDFIGMGTEDMDGNLATTNDAASLIYWGDDGNEPLNFKSLLYSGTGFTPRTVATFLPGGNVGINVTAPTKKLEVSSDANAAIYGTRNFNGVANSDAGFIGGIDASYTNTGVYFVQKDNISLGSYATNLINVVSNGIPQMVVNGTGNMRVGRQFFNSQSGGAATSPDVVNMKFAVMGGFSSFGNYNNDPAGGVAAPDRTWTGGVGSLVLGMNRIGGTSNVDFWNTTDPGNGAAALTPTDRGFNWRNFNFVAGSAVENSLMTLNGLGNLTISGTNYFTSDKRLKTSVKEFSDNTLAKVMRLQPSTYLKHSSTIDASGNILVNYSDTPINDFGFIAQDVYEVFPELVNKPQNESKELWSVDYARLSVMLTKAMQEQQKVIDAQEERIQKLEKAVSDLLEKK